MHVQLFGADVDLQDCPADLALVLMYIKKLLQKPEF